MSENHVRVISPKDRGDKRPLFFFACLATKGNIENYALPSNFNLNEHLAQYPPHEWGFPKDMKFRKDNAYAFLSLIASIPARNSDLIDEDGYVPIMMGKLKNNIRDITPYKHYLLKTGVIEHVGQYFPGVKSDRYRWAGKYANVPFEIQRVLCRWTDDVAKYDNSTDIQEYPYLFDWYRQKKLSLDPVATRYAWAIKEHKMHDTTKESWDINRDKGCKKYPVTQYYAAMLNIGKLRSHQYEAHIDNNIHRLHSVLTNLQKDYRNFITYDGQNLAGVDIKNCQPYLACLILNPQFWNETADLPLKFSTLPQNVQNYFPEVVLREIRAFFERVDIDGFKEFTRITSSGQMYEEIASIANQRIENLTSPLMRADAKTLMFYMLFSSNTGKHDDPAINEMKSLFEGELFPQVAELFGIIKKRHKGVEQDKQHNRLSVLLQSIESQIVLHGCCKRIWEERGGQVPIFTIHDSIVTPLEHTDYVEHVMMQELTDYIGIQPTLSIEVWSMTNLDPSILEETRRSINK